jgi:2,3,4,5-tetrahydropyridine-2,6-dicarboxylate N-succinyltransferase
MNILREQIEFLFTLSKDGLNNEKNRQEVFENFLQALDTGAIRAAENNNGEWKVNEWVKKGILLGFRIGKVIDMSMGAMNYFDKSTYPLKNISLENNIRIVPGGTSIRRGAYISDDVAVIPPSFVNVGAYVDSGTMLDSHSLIGSCAQIGKRCHISASAQIGGVLEPTSARPVIIEDDVFVGGNTGIYEGAVIKKGSVIAAGVVITSSTKVFDLVNQTTIGSEGNTGIVIPENAVVVGGSRVLTGEF